LDYYLRITIYEKFFTLPLDFKVEEVIIIVDTLARRVGVEVVE
jgi:hypothetical protein